MICSVCRCAGLDAGLLWASLYVPAVTPNNMRSELEPSTMHNCFRCSELKLCGPRDGLNLSTLQGLVYGVRRHFAR
eukprot:10571945-Alexandrium_andersonii.AAC.1